MIDIFVAENNAFQSVIHMRVTSHLVRTKRAWSFTTHSWEAMVQKVLSRRKSFENLIGSQALHGLVATLDARRTIYMSDKKLNEMEFKFTPSEAQELLDLRVAMGSVGGDFTKIIPERTFSKGKTFKPLKKAERT